MKPPQKSDATGPRPDPETREGSSRRPVPAAAEKDDPSRLGTALAGEGYHCSHEIAVTAWLALSLARPLLVEGPAGVGKTELARALAAATGRELIRLQCYEGLDESRALYEWDYARQLLYTQLLKEQVGAALSSAGSLREAAAALKKEESAFFSPDFLLPRPVLKAILSPRPSLLLVDEIDRSDPEFEAFLLEVLADFQVSVPELGTLRARVRPAVVLTSNAQRALSEALRRRCLYLYVDYPAFDLELQIVRAKVPGLDEKLAREAVRLAQKARRLDLRKAPSIGETLDWAAAILLLNAGSLSREVLVRTLPALLKDRDDVDKFLREAARG